MRALEIALFILVFNVSLSIVAQTGLFADSTQIQSSIGIFSVINTTIPATTYDPPSPIEAFALAAWQSVIGVANFIFIVLTTLGLIPVTISQLLFLPITHPIVIALQILVYAVYGLGIAQFFTGRSSRDMD